MEKHWQIPIGAPNPEVYVVELLVELNRKGYIVKIEWVNRGLNAKNSFSIIAANNAIRGLKDAEKQLGPINIPPELYSQWKSNTYRFDPSKLINIDLF